MWSSTHPASPSFRVRVSGLMVVYARAPLDSCATTASLGRPLHAAWRPAQVRAGGLVAPEHRQQKGGRLPSSLSYLPTSAFSSPSPTTSTKAITTPILPPQSLLPILTDFHPQQDFCHFYSANSSFLRNATDSKIATFLLVALKLAQK